MEVQLCVLCFGTVTDSRGAAKIYLLMGLDLLWGNSSSLRLVRWFCFSRFALIGSAGFFLRDDAQCFGRGNAVIE